MAQLTVDTPDGPFTLARACDGCTLCCRVMEAVTLNKPAGVLCEHCIVGKGCGIRETRGQECRHFHCGWLIDGTLGPEWHPETAHIVIAYDQDGARFCAHADPLYPDAWRAEPYYSYLKNLAGVALPLGKQVVGFVDKDMTMFLPDRDVHIGVPPPDTFIFIEDLGDGRWDARLVDETEAGALRTAGRV
jgi:hypothetical protein